MTATAAVSVDDIVAAQERVERLLRSKAIRRSARGIWGNMYFAMKDVASLEDLEEFARRLERAREPRGDSSVG